MAGIESWLSLIEKSSGADEARYYQNAVAESGLATIGESNPIQARDWLVKRAARGVINAGSMNRIMSDNKLSTGPEDALSLIAMARPADPKDAGSYSQLVAEKFGDYLERDFNAAGAWLAAQPRDTRNDGAIQKFALEAARADRDTALLWVEQISDQRLLEATLASPEFTGNSTVVRPR